MTFAKQVEDVTGQVNEAANKLTRSIRDLVSEGLASEQRATVAEERAAAAEARADAAEGKLRQLYAVIDKASSFANSNDKPEASAEPTPVRKPEPETKRPAKKKASAAKKPAIGLPLPKRKPRTKKRSKRLASESDPARSAAIIEAVAKTPGKSSEFYRKETGRAKSPWWHKAVSELVESGELILKDDAYYLPELEEAA